MSSDEDEENSQNYSKSSYSEVYPKDSERNLIALHEPTAINTTDYYDYHFVEYHLRASLGVKNPINILAIHNVKNEEQLAKIDDIEKNTQWTYGWYRLRQKYPDIIGVLKTKGFIEKDRDKESQLFTVGNIVGNNNSSVSGDCPYLLCKLYIGNSLCVQSQNFDKSNIPPYFNSYKIITSENKSVQLNRKITGDSKDVPYISYQYDILKPNYICPLYVVKFQTIQESAQKLIDSYYCYKCGTSKPADLFCLDCETYFDTECYQSRHKGKGTNQNELRHCEPQILKYKQREGKCSEHDDRDAEYYCLTCKKPICSKCKIKVNKIASIHSSHPVKDIFTAYEEEIPYTYMAEEIRKRAVTQLIKIKKTVKALIEKQIMIEKEIDHEFRDENDSIQSLTKEAKLKHFSVSAELSEMKKHLSNMDSYYEKCKKAMKDAKLKPEAMWIKENHEEVINDIYDNFKEINPNYKVNPNSFKNIKQTNLRIIKKIDVKKTASGTIMDDSVCLNDIIKKDDQYILTKKIVSLKKEKDDEKNRKQQRERETGKQNFDPNNVEFGYALYETHIKKQDYKVNLDIEKEKSKKEEEDKKKKFKDIIKVLDNAPSNTNYINDQ